MNDIIKKYLAKHGYSHFDPKAALIDMDGTLYDSMKNHAEAWMRVATEAGFDVRREDFFLYEGRTGASTIDILVRNKYGRPATDNEKTTLYHKKTIYFNQLPRVEAMPGAYALLRALAQHGIVRVLVTGSGQSSLISRLNDDFPGMFAEQLRITSANVTHGKPDPEPYQKAMALAGVEPWQSIAIENAPMGVESAARAKAFTVGVVTGPIPREALFAAGADIVYDSMPQCAESLPRLLFP